VRPLLLVFVVGLLLAGCTSETPPGPSYTPVPDEVLFAQVAALPGVASQHLEYLDDFGNPNVYSGTVEAAKGVDPRRLLDAVLALLRTGHPNAGLAVAVSSRSLGSQVGPDSLGLFLKDDFERRYGPQPGDGVPPTELPPATTR